TRLSSDHIALTLFFAGDRFAAVGNRDSVHPRGGGGERSSRRGVAMEPAALAVRHTLRARRRTGTLLRRYDIGGCEGHEEPETSATPGGSMKRLVLALAALVVAASAYAQPFVWPSAWSSATPDEAVRGGVLRDYMIGDPRTFNPITSAESTALTTVIFDSSALLITRGPDSDESVPYAAESFTISEDGRTVDVTLRDGILWSDGTPVTVQDYYTTYLLESDPDVGSNGYDSWFIGDDQITLEITGEKSLRFHFPRPDRLALPVVAMAP